MRVESIMIDDIDLPARLRAVDGARAASLAESMKALGLQQPITVWPEPDGPFILVAGAHRLAAAKSLGWCWIDAVFTDADEIDRQLWEIDENLMRSELTPTEQAEHLAKRKELWEVRKESGNTVPTLTGRGNKQFASDTAEKTGVTKRQINKSVSRARDVCDEARDLIRGTALDTGVFLDKLKRLPLDEQVEFAQRHLERFNRPPSKPKHAPDPDNDFVVKERQVAALMAAWNKAGREAREEFLDRVDTPVMDRSNYQ